MHRLNRETLVVLLLAVLAVGAVAVASGAAAGQSQENLVAIDGDTRLDSDDARAEYRSDGVTNATVSEYQLTVSVADSHDSVGLDGVYTDADAAYLRVDYDEDIQRTFRFYVPSSYWYPHVLEGHDAENNDVAMDMRSVENSTMTAVTVTLDGQTDAVFRISRAAGTIYRVRDEGRSVIENVTGWDIPSITGGGEPWQRIESSQLSGENATVPIQTNGSAYTLQYDTSREPASSSWVNLPECESITGRDAPVCYDTRDSEDYVWVYSRTEGDAPAVRYRAGSGGLLTGIKSGLNDLMNIPNDIMSLFDGGDG